MVGVRFVDPLPPTPPELIPGFLPAEGTTYICGPTNVGKSLIAIEIASALTAGRPLWGQLPATRRINRVCYLLGEHTTGTIHKLFKFMGVPMGADAYIVGPTDLPAGKQLVQRGELQQQTWLDYRAIVEGSELLIVDPLAAFISGANAEQDNAAMRHLIDGFSKLGQENGCPVILLGHFGKPHTTADGQDHYRRQYASRGASSAEDSVETVYYLQAEAGLYSLTCAKYKGETPDKRLLMRDRSCRHTLMVTNRPNVEAERVRFVGEVARLEAIGLDHADAVKAVAEIRQVPLRTARRYVAGTDGAGAQMNLFGGTLEATATPGLSEGD